MLKIADPLKFLRIRLFLVVLMIFCTLFAGISFFRSYATPANAAVSEKANSNFPVVDGSVYSSLHDGDTTYIGGDFNYIGKQSGHGIPLDTFDGEPDIMRGFARVNDTVRISTSDGNGGWYIGGAFTQVDQEVRDGIAHINADGTLDEDWSIAISDTFSPSIEALAFDGTYLYIGGTFTEVDGQSRENLASVNVASEDVTAWSPNPDAGINDLKIDGDILYVGGNNFTEISGQSRAVFASYDISDGTPDITSWAPEGDNPAYDLEIEGDYVYAAGDFWEIDGNSRKYLAKIHKTTGALDSWNPDPTGTVWSIDIDEDLIYVGGQFGLIGGENRDGLAAVDINDGSVSGDWNPSLDGGIDSLLVKDDLVYISGSFFEVQGELRTNFALLGKADASLEGFRLEMENTVLTMSESGDGIYLGGYFAMYDVYDRPSLAAFNNQTGEILDLRLDAFGASIYDMILDGDNLYLAGSIVSIQGIDRNNVAAIDKNSGNLLGWDPNTDCTVLSMDKEGSVIYLGGWFDEVGGELRSRLAAVDSYPHGATTILDWDPNISSVGTKMISDVEATGTNIYVAGIFDNVGSDPRDGLAAIDPELSIATSWHPVGFNNAADILIDEANSLVYVGGWFNTFTGPRNYLAAIDISTGNETAWFPDVDSLVSTIDLVGDTLYVGGEFEEIDGVTRNKLAAFDTTTGDLTSWNPSVNTSGNISDVSHDSSDWIYAGGFYDTIGGFAQSNFARFNDPEVEFEENKVINEESVSEYDVPVILSQTSNVDITVDYEVTGGSATDGDDYTFNNGTATVLDGELSTTIPIEINDDSDIEDLETIVITLSNPSNGVIGERYIFKYVIEDDDDLDPTPTPSPSPSDSPTPSSTPTDEPTPTESVSPTATFAPTSSPGKSTGGGSSNPTDYVTPTEEPPVAQITETITPTTTPTDDVKPRDIILEIKVIDVNGKPVQDALVSIPALKRNERTNESGVATFKDIKEGEYEVKISYKNQDISTTTIQAFVKGASNSSEPLSLQIEVKVPDFSESASVLGDLVKEIGVLGAVSSVTAGVIGILYAVELFSIFKYLITGGFLLPLLSLIFRRGKHGVVRDDFSREGISFVAIRVFDQTGDVIKKAVSTLTGKFFLSLAPGNYRVEFFRRDYSIKEIQLPVATETSLERNVDMSKIESKDIAAQVQYQVFKVDPKALTLYFAVLLAGLNLIFVRTFSSILILVVVLVFALAVFLARKRQKTLAAQTISVQ